MTDLVLKDVSRRYGTALAIDGINLSVTDGEFLTLLGPSGCGKSHTLSAIAGLDNPQADASLWRSGVGGCCIRHLSCA